MIYRSIGTMSGSSMDGLDIAYCTFEEVGGKWSVEITTTDCIAFPKVWIEKLHIITQLTAKDLMLTHTAFGKWMGDTIHSFIEKNNLEHKVHLIASHGHTVFHDPAQAMTFQMGDGAAIAIATKLPVVSDLRNMDVALGGEGAPIVPMAEKLLWHHYDYFLNLGGIGNVSINDNNHYVAFDVCPVNRVLNLLVGELGKTFDADGYEAAKGKVNDDLLSDLNALPYYQKAFPKSLANEFGSDEIFSIISHYDISVQDKLCTMCEHVAQQIRLAFQRFQKNEPTKLLVTGGGAYNQYLIQRIREALAMIDIELIIPNENLINYKEAIAMALIGVLRWREEENVLASVTGATRNSVGGALWMGQV
jgi:anhydro-N-acetylmuramic acid kinase